jgi:phospholipid/cholesterol/gamma-HCH transport system substrate-binding protein
MEKSTGRSIRLGIMVIIGITVFTIAAYLIGQKRDMFNKTFTLKAVFNNVNGLQHGNNVRFAGINVGSVTSIVIENDSTIEVTLRIKEKVRPYIKKNAFVAIGTDGLMGNMLVNISPGQGNAAVVNDNDVLEAYSRIKTDDILKTLNVTNENAALLTANLLEMTQSVMHGNGVISYLMYDTLFSKKLDESIRNLASTTQKTNQLMKSAQEIAQQISDGKGLAGWILNDTLSQKEFAGTLSELNKAASDINSSAAKLRITIDQLKEGEGTLPALLSDTTMKSNLTQTLENLNQGTKKFNQNMEALKHSFLTRGYFKKQKRDSLKNAKR